MFVYDKKLQYPVKIANTNPRLAAIIISQYGGPDGELGASLRYLSQRYSMPFDDLKGLLTDIGTEELAHWEMLGTMIYQSIQGASIQELEAAGLLGYYTMHKRGVYPASPEGVPFTAAYIASTGDPIADIVEDLSAEQKARATYENLMDQTDCPEYLNPLRFLRQREIVHYQRFGECLEILQSIIPNNNEKVRFVANGRVIDSGCACVD